MARSATNRLSDVQNRFLCKLHESNGVYGRVVVAKSTCPSILSKHGQKVMDQHCTRDVERRKDVSRFERVRQS